MSFTDAFENAVLNAILGAGATLLPGTVYIGLSTTAPADDGSNFTEPGSGSYARVAVTNDGSGWSAAVAGVKSCAAAIIFPTATASWGTVGYFGIFTAASGGVPQITGALDAPRPIGNTDAFRFQASNCKVTLD